eukprot:CAMPEP_0194366000 /NCGR_PEP_ID=MMETSP0174-20130528/14011_1 /TAXON_ID=216777 /ORGANISM="Proboscia alata, Strain PI-D3" /LENGTH=223 /DNA_ID=CAMNT_0039140939 /DNA_START=43 /DNA_END=714 /DNA_ORIENTATION=-
MVRNCKFAIILTLLYKSLWLTLMKVEAFNIPPSFIRIRDRITHSQVCCFAINIDDIETRALEASEAWDFTATPFLNAEEASAVEKRLCQRGDLAFRRVPSSSSERARFIFTNPELEITDASDYAVTLRIDNVALASVDPWANVLDSIGVELDKVGDILVVDGSSVFMAVDPSVAKSCSRLLPKQLPGAGVTVSLLESDDSIPNDGELQNMDFQRLDKRSQKRK